MIKLFSTENPNTAEIIKQMLEENNINVVLLNKQDSSYNMFGSVELYIEKDNIESAKSLITKAQYE